MRLLELDAEQLVWLARQDAAEGALANVVGVRALVLDLGGRQLYQARLLRLIAILLIRLHHHHLVVVGQLALVKRLRHLRVGALLDSALSANL